MRKLIAAFGCLILGALAHGPAAAAVLDKVAPPAGTVVVPDHFLRAWDPVTVFLPADTGPAGGGPEDHPERFVTMVPAQPGAFSWLDARTLQFRPAVPWPALARVTVTLGSQATRLVALISAPAGMAPQAGSTARAVDRLRLDFPGPVDPAALARLLTIEARPLPGIDAAQAQLLDGKDFAVQAADRAAGTAKASYLVLLRQPLPPASRILVHLKLSDEPGLDPPLADLEFATEAAVAQVDAVGCAYGSDMRAGIDHCTGDSEPVVDVRFDHDMAPASPTELRQFVRISPPVDDVTYAQYGSTLTVRGKFAYDTVYTVTLADADLHAASGVPLAGATGKTDRIVFDRPSPVLAYEEASGIVERYGPQRVPLHGRGYDQVDLRIHAIDPLDRGFWPYAGSPVTVDDQAEPPLPGLEPGPYASAARVSAETLARRIKALGSPSVSELVPLPISKLSLRSKFGLDLKPYLERIGGRDGPGTYLVGLRRIDSSTKRDWMRVQVTDLSVSVLEELDHVHFFVTSLATARPVDGATVTLEGNSGNKGWETIARGTTDADGQFDWAPAGNRKGWRLQRLAVAKGLDHLVIDPDKPPRPYNGLVAASDTGGSAAGWLAWTLEPLAPRRPPPQLVCHVFTERPIYRPEEPVHIKGYVRLHDAGQLSFARGTGTLVVTGPNDVEWRYPVDLGDAGSFYHKFDVQTQATGDYAAHFEGPGKASCGDVPFKKEAYRLPTFELVFNAPPQVPLDQPFKVDVTGRYFAGGLVADRPVKWRVAQYPYNWQPKGPDGFHYSTDSRFSNQEAFRSTPVLERDARTDGAGVASLALDPTIEPTAQPRRYVVEATVTSDDDIVVRNTASVLALPPFVLGLKVPRYLPQGDAIRPEIAVLDADGKRIAGQPVTVRLIKRRWSSVLQASDFTQGTAKYVTNIVEDKLAEQTLASTADAQTLTLPAKGAGVYVVEIESRDKLGRTQTVSIDLFMDGATPVTWSKPPAETAAVTADKDSYVPGESAKLVVQSPFQTARALVVVEQPDSRNQYSWVDIANGFGTVTVPIEARYMPRVPIHMLILRGRIGDAQGSSGPFDLGKPTTVAATTWLKVRPVKNTLQVSLDYPKQARPRDQVDVVVHVSDDLGQPVSGELTFWMVDQAIFTLAKEQPLDPLPPFIVEHPSRLQIRDSRAMAFGLLPLALDPGGDAPIEEQGVDVSVRKNFTPVPVYLPSVKVGPDGIARLKVTLPDSLTVFKLRAKVASGTSRFGFAIGDMQVRLPLLAQPALPRFVRSGDRFDAVVLGRLIEGAGGPGKASIAAPGLDPGQADQAFTWSAGTPARVAFPVAVPTLETKPDGTPVRDAVAIRFAVEREADKVRDDIEIDLPLKPDRRPVVERRLATLDAAKGQGAGHLELPALAQPARAGTVQRLVEVATDPAVVEMIAGLNYLVEYPYGCTEQRVSRARVEIAAHKLAAVVGDADPGARVATDVRQTVAWIGQTLTDDGLVAYWPHARGYVGLSAWSLMFLVEAQQAGQTVPKPLVDSIAHALKQALRSDYPRLLKGSEDIERSWALVALAAAGQLDRGYAADLARKAAFLPVESQAQILYVLARSGAADPGTVSSLAGRMWAGIVVQDVDGRPRYIGLQSPPAGNGVLLPSEVRTLAQMLRADLVAQPGDSRRGLITDALLRLGRGDGWGDTNTNAEAMLALADVIGAGTAPQATVTVTGGGAQRRLDVGGIRPIERMLLLDPGPAALDAAPGAAPVLARVSTRFLPAAPGNQATAAANGLVIRRDSYRLPPGGGPLAKLEPAGADHDIGLTAGDIVEDAVEVVNPADRNHVAIVVPLAAGMEPLNPRLANAQAEAKPQGEVTLDPSYAAYLDDEVAFYYDSLPKGTYRLYFRSRANVVGRFIQPPSTAELMYDAAVAGSTDGARITIQR